MISTGRTPRSFVTAAALCGIAFGLAGCASEVAMEPAANANDPDCASVVVQLPKTVAGMAKRATNAQATGAWGDPVAVQLRCGIEPSGPTTDDCVNVNGVDWIIDRSQPPIYRFEAYGRSPGLEVYVDAELVSGTEVALDFTNSASLLPQERKCTSLVDTLDDSGLSDQAQ